MDGTAAAAIDPAMKGYSLRRARKKHRRLEQLMKIPTSQFLSEQLLIKQPSFFKYSSLMEDSMYRKDFDEDGTSCTYSFGPLHMHLVDTVDGATCIDSNSKQFVFTLVPR